MPRRRLASGEFSHACTNLLGMSQPVHTSGPYLIEFKNDDGGAWYQDRHEFMTLDAAKIHAEDLVLNGKLAARVMAVLHYTARPTTA